MITFLLFCRCSSSFQNREVCFSRNINDRFVIQILLLSYPEVLDEGWADGAVFDANSFGSTFCSFNFGLSIELFSFKVCLRFFDLDLAVLLCFYEFCLPASSASQTPYLGSTHIARPINPHPQVRSIVIPIVFFGIFILFVYLGEFLICLFFS